MGTETSIFLGKKGGKIDPLKGVLYFSLLSKSLFMLGSAKDVSVGRDFARRWLFKGINWREKIVKGLLKFSEQCRNFDFSNFVEQIFSSDFKTNCKRFKIDLVESLSETMTKSFESFQEKDLTSAIKSFCLLIDFTLFYCGIWDRVNLRFLITTMVINIPTTINALAMISLSKGMIDA